MRGMLGPAYFFSFFAISSINFDVATRRPAGRAVCSTAPGSAAS